MSFRVRLCNGKLELVSTGVDGLFEVGDMPEYSAGLYGSYSSTGSYCFQTDSKLCTPRDIQEKLKVYFRVWRN